MNAKGRIEARGRKHAEALHHAEIFGRDQLHAESAHQHHAEGDRRTNTVGAAGSALNACHNDHGQRYDGQQHHQRGDDHMHHILKRPGIAAVAQREHPIPDRRDPLHDGEQINA